MLASMRVIVFASQKGGSGKTTLSGHIAVEAGRQGAGPVALIDTDPQGSLSKWWNVRQDPEPAFIQSVFSNLFQDLNRARDEGFRLVVVDTPPAVTRAISEVVGFADLVVAPTRPSPHDLRAVGPTVDIAESRSKPLVFVVNGATPKARITSEAAIALSQHGTVAPTVVHHRVDFAAAMIDGRTVMEIDPVCKSASEIKELWRYLHERLMRQDGGYKSMETNAYQPAFASAQRVFGRRLAQ
jgi:chromosome partitioning protein